MFPVTTIDHAIVFQHGESFGDLMFAHHNDITAGLLSKVCSDVATKPPLQSLSSYSTFTAPQWLLQLGYSISVTPPLQPLSGYSTFTAPRLLHLYSPSVTPLLQFLSYSTFTAPAPLQPLHLYSPSMVTPPLQPLSGYSTFTAPQWLLHLYSPSVTPPLQLLSYSTFTAPQWLLHLYSPSVVTPPQWLLHLYSPSVVTPPLQPLNGYSTFTAPQLLHLYSPPVVTPPLQPLSGYSTFTAPRLLHLYSPSVTPPLQPLSYSTFTAPRLLQSLPIDRMMPELIYMHLASGSVLFDIKVFHQGTVTPAYHHHELQKKIEYGERVQDVELASFTPLVLATTSGMGKEALAFYCHLADLLSHYSSMSTLMIHCTLFFSLLQSSTMCSWGT